MGIRAREREVYDELVRDELTAYLTDCNATFDAIVSADTLVYFGPLDGVVAAAAGALRPSGTVVFTVEELTGSGYALGTSGRYRHSREHIESVMTKNGLEVEIVSAELRLEAGEPVAGLLVHGTKPLAIGQPVGDL